MTKTNCAMMTVSALAPTDSFVRWLGAISFVGSAPCVLSEKEAVGIVYFGCPTLIETGQLVVSSSASQHSTAVLVFLSKYQSLVLSAHALPMNFYLFTFIAVTDSFSNTVVCNSYCIEAHCVS